MIGPMDATKAERDRTGSDARLAADRGAPPAPDGSERDRAGSNGIEGPVSRGGDPLVSGRPLSADESILLLLRERGVLATADLASALDLPDGSVRRHLRRLIRGGYLFSPDHGRYRITAAGAAAMAPLSEIARNVVTTAPIQPPPALAPTAAPAPAGPGEDPRGKLWAFICRR
jgi:DNA-binding transcriptional ArsR family regulator